MLEAGGKEGRKDRHRAGQDFFSQGRGLPRTAHPVAEGKGRMNGQRRPAPPAMPAGAESPVQPHPHPVEGVSLNRWGNGGTKPAVMGESGLCPKLLPDPYRARVRAERGGHPPPRGPALCAAQCGSGASRLLPGTLPGLCREQRGCTPRCPLPWQAHHASSRLRLEVPSEETDKRGGETWKSRQGPPTRPEAPLRRAMYVHPLL